MRNDNKTLRYFSQGKYLKNQNSQDKQKGVNCYGKYNFCHLNQGGFCPRKRLRIKSYYSWHRKQSFPEGCRSGAPEEVLINKYLIFSEQEAPILN